VTDLLPSLSWAHPIVQEWFSQRFPSPTEPQEQGWPHIVAGTDTLISAPTGSGKTLAAFLASIDRLVRKALRGELADRTEVLYVSPLKALGNDIHKNLEMPLREITETALSQGFLVPPIRSAVRTGDTLAPERRAMLKRPPHILVTTPESLYILLTAERSRAILKEVETVIVDEIHAVADDKRGAHLALSLERLDALVASAHLGRGLPVRIGLSATQKPIERVASFLAGAGRAAPRVINIGHQRPMDLAVEVPQGEMGAVASNEMWEDVYNRLAALALDHRSTLVFVNTRRLAERVTHHLAERLGEDRVAAHHGSLSRKLRLAAERKLKSGEARALVATASLELGIDIGTVDLVCQIGSPRSIGVALQRIGRAGHWRGAVPKGRIFAMTRDELVECAALVRAIRSGCLDELEIPEAPLDIMAQQIVAMCSCEEWKEEDLFGIIRRAHPYRELSRGDFDAIVAMLSDGIAAHRGRYSAYLYRDRVNGRLRGRRGSRLTAVTGGGAIPETALYAVVAMPEGTVVGTVDEDFAVESLSGDVMLLGNTSWRIRRVESRSGRLLVEDAHGAAPNIPFWRGEAPARTAELSAQVSEIREMVSAMIAAGDGASAGTRPPHPANSAPDFAETGRHPIPHGGEGIIKDSAGQDAVPDDINHCASVISVSGPRFIGAARGQLISSALAADQGLKPSTISPADEARLKPCPDTQHAGIHDALLSPENPQTTAGSPNATPAPNAPGRAAAMRLLTEECGLESAAASQAIDYIAAGRAVLGAVPASKTVIAERFFDEAGGMQLIIHAPLGGRINKAWGLALRKRFCRSFNFELQAAATENGLNLSLGEQHSFPLADVFRFLDVNSVTAVLEQAVLASPIFNNRWRWDANRSLALPRFRNGQKVPLYLQRMRSDDLLAAVFPEAAACQENIVGDIQIPDHPLVREVMKDALTEAMDIDGLKRVLAEIASGTIVCRAIDTPAPSVFSHEILNANPYAFLDDAPLEERRARAVELRRVLPETVLENIGQLDPTAIACVREEAWPDVRDADEAADALLTLVALPDSLVAPDGASSKWGEYLRALAQDKRAARAVRGERAWWVAAEKARAFAAIFPDALLESGPAPLESAEISREEAIKQMVGGWMAHIGPTTAEWLAELLGVPGGEVDGALLQLEASGAVLRGQFTQTKTLEWCERRLLARIHRRTLGTLRAQIAPVTPQQFMRWLLEWQHVEPAAQVQGERGVLEIIRQLQGFEIPANSWEPEILARRVARYDPEVLDRLCLTGAIGWGRISPPSALNHPGGDGRRPVSRRVVPSSVVPIAFFLRGETDWMAPRLTESGQAAAGLSHAGRAILEFLRLRGASFFADIVSGTGRLKSEVETALWELVGAGLVTADGFDNLRALIDPKRRAGQGRGKTARPRHSTGRWSLLHSGAPAEKARQAEMICTILLERYGVVFRDLLARESFDIKWHDLLVAFRRMEDRGEVRGGRFVDGFVGEQFALPVAVESLRAMRNASPADKAVDLQAADPLNLVGIVIPGERVPALSKRHITLWDGALVDDSLGTYLSTPRTAAVEVRETAQGPY
jgi:ATP-dependent helicase Lhr and Lhr-like helicase